MSEALEIEVIEDPVPVAEKATPTLVDSFRFDLLVDTTKIDGDKLAKDVQEKMLEFTGSRYWRASLEDPGSMDIEEPSYSSYSSGSVVPQIIQVWLEPRPELSSSLALTVREACLAGIARQPEQSVWTNGVGDLWFDAGMYDIEYRPLSLPNSVMLDTGSSIGKTKGKKMRRLKFTISMPDNTSITSWDAVRSLINAQVQKVGWQRWSDDYNSSGTFGGNMYKWSIEFARSDGKYASVDAAEITKVWEACLTGVHEYRLANEQSIIIVRGGHGTMQLGDESWEMLAPPPFLFVGNS